MGTNSLVLGKAHSADRSTPRLLFVERAGERLLMAVILLHTFYPLTELVHILKSVCDQRHLHVRKKKLIICIWLFVSENKFGWRQTAATVDWSSYCWSWVRDIVEGGERRGDRERAAHWWIIHRYVLYYCYWSLLMHRGIILLFSFELRPPLTSTPLNQASILWYYTSIIYHPSRQIPLSPALLWHPVIHCRCGFYKKHLAKKYICIRMYISYILLIHPTLHICI